MISVKKSKKKYKNKVGFLKIWTTTNEGIYSMKEIIQKYFEGRASNSEQKQLLDWMKNEDNQITFKNEKVSWKKELPKSMMGKETEKGLIRFQSHIMKDEFNHLMRLKKLRSLYKYAAVVMLLIIVGGGSFVVKDMLAGPLYTRVVADNGQVSRIVLPDNSEVWLNSGSVLTYNNKFAQSNRDLKLEGQAYFDISNNAGMPLNVRSQDVDVQVLGTKFEVEAYPSSNVTSVILEEGSVEMSFVNKSAKKLLLKPGHQVVYERDKAKVVRKTVKVDKYTSWRKGILNIYDCPLSEAALKLERRFNYKFKVTDELKDYKITISIEDEEFDDVINILRHITAVNINHRNDTIYFESRMK
ncbi:MULTISPECIES: FecR family protein [unclassified Saccharicrinis]|uniref:FecR family protein n=1 Tax=unclassified Saccharicrinis TaxID=2646859 RepID=UPI003D347372